MPPTAILLIGLLALLVLIPTRRLQLAGWSRQSLTVYFLGMWFLGALVAAFPSPARFILPILLVAYIAPFVTLRDGLDRLMGRPPRDRGGVDRVEGQPQMKDVTPPDDPAGTLAADQHR